MNTKVGTRAKRRRQNAQCPICGRMFSGQGLSGHMRFVHHTPATVCSKRLPKARVEMRTPGIDERTPYLVKPLMSYKELTKRLLKEMELWDHKQPSPCCKAILRSAKRVLGMSIKELDGCYICGNCGEWYHLEPDKDKPMALRTKDGKMIYESKLVHLIQEIPTDAELDESYSGEDRLG